MDCSLDDCGPAEDCGVSGLSWVGKIQVLRSGYGLNPRQWQMCWSIEASGWSRCAICSSSATCGGLRTPDVYANGVQNLGLLVAVWVR